jgi:hypothetical protein
MFGMNYNKRTAITQNLSQLPNADEIYKTLYFMSLKCQSIMAQRVPDGEKIRQWNDVIDQMANNRLPKRTEVIPPPPPGPRPVPNPGSKQLPPKRPEPWAADLIGSWKSDGWDPENNIPATILYTFNPDGSFLSIEGHYGESRGRFEYKRGHVLIEWENGTKEFAELLLTGTKNQFQYYIVDHTDQRHIGGKFIFQRVR